MTNQTADTMNADLRAEFEKWARGKSLEMIRDRDAWGREKYKHSHIDAMWEAYQAAAHATARRCAELTHLHFKVGEDTEASDLIKDAFPEAFGEG